MANVKIETVSKDSFSMDYFRFGNGRKDLVILPGLSVQSVMDFADMVADAYSVLTDDYTVYVFDRRKELPEKYSVYDMARDTAAAIDELGLEQVSVMGASQGGMMALVIAIERPELIKKMVLCSTAPCADESWYRTAGKWIGIAKSGNAEELYLAFGEAVYPKEMYEQSKELLTGAAAAVTEEDMERFVILTEGMEGFDVAGDLGKIRCPVFVVGSMDDAVFGPEPSERIRDLLVNSADAELYLYDGYGHAVYDTAPDYKERMLEFLKNDGKNI